MKTERQRQHEQYKKRMDKQAEHRRQAKERQQKMSPAERRFFWDMLVVMTLIILL